MFQEHGKQIWRQSGALLLGSLLMGLTVVAFAILRPVTDTPALPALPVLPTPAGLTQTAGAEPIIPPFARALIGNRWAVYSDGRYTIRTLERIVANSLVAGQSRPPLVVSLDSPDSNPVPTNGNHYLTLGATGELFVLPASIRALTPANAGNSALVAIARVGDKHIYQAKLPGYYRIETQSTDSQYRWYNLFVSPIPSVHLDRSDRNWYLTQWNTETTSNCGPTVAAMAVRWASAALPEVLDIRQFLGWSGNGAVSNQDLQEALRAYQVKSRIIDLKSVKDIFAALDRGHLISIVYDMAGLQRIEEPQQNLMGQYYDDHGGHYLAVKGYSKDRKWFIVYDPIPSDWAGNRMRYADGISMIGRNRYYDTDQIWQALRSRQALEIHR